MNGNQPIATVKGMSPLTTAKFGPGMLLQSDDLEQLSNYTRDLSRLLFRSFFGCGVVCGLDIPDPQPVQCGKLVFTVNPGLALDCCGDPIYVPQPQPITVDTSCNQDTQLWVVLCGTRKCCAPRPAMCSADDQDSPSVCTRERYGFELRVLNDSSQVTCMCGCGSKDNCTPQAAFNPSSTQNMCQCADPAMSCNQNHYNGICDCSCIDSSNCQCQCDCILLAQLTTQDQQNWTVDYSGRCFIRPMRIRDPKLPPTKTT